MPHPPACKLHRVGTKSVLFTDNPQRLARRRALAFSNKRKKLHSLPHHQRDLSRKQIKPPPPPALSLLWLPCILRAKSKGFTKAFPGPWRWSLTAPAPSSSAIRLSLYTPATLSFFRCLESPMFSLTSRFARMLRLCLEILSRKILLLIVKTLLKSCLL